MNITKQIEELQEKANKYDNMRDRYVEHAKEVDKLVKEVENIAKQLKELRNHIDPMLSMSDRKRGPRTGEQVEIRKEFYQKLLEGVQITGDLISGTYPDLTTKQVSQILFQLSKMPKVQKAKDGRNLRLYVSKEM